VPRVGALPRMRRPVTALAMIGGGVLGIAIALRLFEMLWRRRRTPAAEAPRTLTFAEREQMRQIATNRLAALERHAQREARKN
jgi:hypothetical protein